MVSLFFSLSQLRSHYFVNFSELFWTLLHVHFLFSYLSLRIFSCLPLRPRLLFTLQLFQLILYFYLVFVSVTQWCPSLCNPIGCSPPGSTVNGFLQARIPVWVSVLFSKGASRPRGGTLVSCTAGRFLTYTFKITNYFKFLLYFFR